MISVNQRALKLVRKMVDDSEALGLEIIHLPNGTTLIDAGVKTRGSIKAGLLFAETCLGGLGEVSITRLSYEDPQAGDFWLPAVRVWVDYPPIACMASQFAGWPITTDNYFAMGSGPACAIYSEKSLFDKVGYRDQSDVAVLLLESKELPGEDIAAHVAAKCAVAPDDLTIIVAPTASLVGSVQISARVLETGLHKMLALDFDIRKITAAIGYSPLATIAADELHAMGRSNDAILYGGQVFFTAETEDEELAELVEKMPSLASKDYGTPFADILKRYQGDFYQIDPMLFSPAQVTINNETTGNVFSAGQVNPSLLRASLLKGKH